jgi:hypothetical protein
VVVGDGGELSEQQRRRDTVPVSERPVMTPQHLGVTLVELFPVHQ